MTEPTHAPLTILVVEDDPAIQMLVSRTLRKEGFHVLVAGDVPDALRVSDEWQSSIDLLLTDIMLPSGNGIAMASTLLSKRPRARVLYMSGFTGEAIRAVQYEAGPNGEFLEKPFVPRTLVQRVKAMLPMDAENVPVRAGAREPAMFPRAGANQAPSGEAEYRLERRSGVLSAEKRFPL
ncbi:MAG TPA: response regulator [Vicinamibacterales bacterium]|nr:response regulator [Vicinamibacterales bacterium]